MALQQVTVVYISAPPSTTTTQVIPVPAALQSLDSGQNASSQTGFQAFQAMLSNVAKAGGIFFTNASGVQVFVPLPMIVSIAGQ